MEAIQLKRNEREEWENEYIKSNLVSLIDNIDASKILPFLLQSDIISDTEKNNLESIRRQYGRREESNKLLEIICTRINGYRILTKALYNTKQTNALITLLYGVQENTSGHPFGYCDIEINLGTILTKKVNFEGRQVKLADICKHWSEPKVVALREYIDVPIYKSLIGTAEITVARETIPTVIPYYIKRTLTLRKKLNTKIFVNQLHDIFLIQNIEQHQLTRLAQMSRKKITARVSTHTSHLEDHTTSTGISGEQIFDLTTRFILLQNEQHFDGIRNRANDQNVHHINFKEGSYFLERSTNSHGIKKYILDDEMELSEKDFLETVSDCYPVIIYDTPGMGKSVVLTNLASQVKLKHPTEYVIFYDIKDLVGKILDKNAKLNISLIESVLLDTVSLNKFGSLINRELFNRRCSLIHLFLDAFDEVNSEHHDVAINVVKILCENKHSYNFYITARPHQGDTLEKICGVVGYGIHPFKTEEQVEFMVEYWQKVYNVETSQQVVGFANDCLSTFKDKVSSKEREITGIPLQCKMLADVYAVNVQTKSFSLRDSKLVLNTIYDMYREFFNMKFPDTQLKLGKSELLDVHFKSALDLLFPAYSKNVYAWPEYNCYKEVFAVGIKEVSKSGSEQFVHRTFAEFLVAEFIACLMDNDQVDSKLYVNAFLQFLVDDVLEFVNYDLELKVHSCHAEDKNDKYVCNSSKFKFPVLTFFLGHSIVFNELEQKLAISLQGEKHEKDLFSTRKYEDILIAGIQNNSFGLFMLIRNLPETYFSDMVHQIVYLKQKNKLKSKRTCQLSYAAFYLIVATNLCSLDVLKACFAFVSSLIKIPLHGLKYKSKLYKNLVSLHPLLVAAQRGNYHIFEFVFVHQTPLNLEFVQIVYNCINNSYSDSPTMVEDKIQIIKLLLSKNSNTFKADITAVSLFDCNKIHLDLILFVFAQKSNVFETSCDGDTVAHMVASYFSADEYHKFVEWLIEFNFSSIFQVKNQIHETAVHKALENIEIKNETLKILATQCKVTFNEKGLYGGTELVTAIQYGRSVSLLQKLVELRADIKTQDNSRCTVLCNAVESNNIDALKYFLSLGVNPNLRCERFLSNIWEHVIKTSLNSESSTLSDMAVVLMQNGANINSATKLVAINGDAFKYFDNVVHFGDLVYRPASVLLKEKDLTPECINSLNERSTVSCNVSSCMFTLCCCLAYCCCCGRKPCNYCS